MRAASAGPAWIGGRLTRRFGRSLLTRIMNAVLLVVGVKQSAGDLKLFGCREITAVLYRSRIAVG